MYRVDTDNRRLIKLTPKKLYELGIFERFDLQEWIETSPDILGEELLIIAKELILPSGIRLDLLAIDKTANLVVIELKRGDSGSDVEWQAIKYASYCSNLLAEDIFTSFAEYLQSDVDEAQLKIEEFIEEELDSLNERQRIILVAREFHSDVASAVLWLRDYEVEIKCIRLRSYLDGDGNLFVTPDPIIPLPEAKDYIKRKEVKQKEAKRPVRSTFSLEKGVFELPELERRIRATLNRRTDLTPRLVSLLEIILSEDRVFRREEVKQKLFEKGVGKDVGQTGRYLSNLSQFLTKVSNPHLRQVIEFTSGGNYGETKDAYLVVPEYRELLQQRIDEWNKDNIQSGNATSSEDNFQSKGYKYKPGVT